MCQAGSNVHDLGMALARLSGLLVDLAWCVCPSRWRSLTFATQSVEFVDPGICCPGSGTCHGVDVIVRQCLWNSDGLPVLSQIFSEILEEQDGVVLGAPPFRPSTSNEHFRLAADMNIHACGLGHPSR